MGCHKMESHCMSSSSPLSETMYAKDNRPETPVREKDQQMLYYHKTQSTKSVLSHIVDKVCVRDKTFQEFRERSKSEGRIKDCPTRSKSKSGRINQKRHLGDADWGIFPSLGFIWADQFW